MSKSLLKRIEEIDAIQHLLPDDIEYGNVIWYEIQLMLKELNQNTKEYTKLELNEFLLCAIYQSVSELFFILGKESHNLPKNCLEMIQIEDLIGHAFKDGLQQLIHKLLIPEIDHLIKDIDCCLKISLNREEVLNTYDEYWNVLYLLKDFYSNVIYNSIDPLYLLEQFLSEYSIFLTDLPENLWHIVFTDSYEVERKEYTDEDFDKILTCIYEQTIGEVCSLLKDQKWYHKKFYVKPYPYENIDFQKIQTMTPQELFDDLKLHKGVILNMEDFKFLYFLLNFQNMVFDEERIKRWIHYNKDHSDYMKKFDVEKNVFYGYEISLSDVE